MDITIVNQITEKSTLNNPNDKSQFVNEFVGGSGTDYDVPSTYNPNTDLINDFKVNSTETKRFILINGNTFSRDVFSLLSTNKNDICFIRIYLYEITETLTPTQLRFNLTLNGINLGLMSDFSIYNMTTINEMSSLVINGINVPVNYKGLLQIVVGSRDQYLS